MLSSVKAFKEELLPVTGTLLILLFLAGVLYGILEEDFLPGTEIFALYILAILAYIGGLLMQAVRLPPLLGMLLVGMLFRNWSFIPYHKDISTKWSSIIRDCALCIILLKAGLGLDPVKLSKLKLAVFKLSLIPCLCEAFSSAVFSHFLLGLPWLWSLMLGFILSAVSAAVLVPGMLDLDAKQIGVYKGIPTLILASVSIDNIIALTGFFVTFSIISSEEVSIGVMIKRPLEPFLGLLVGGLLGYLMWWLSKRNNSSQSILYHRLLLLCFGGLTFTFLSKKVGLSGAGALGCVSFAFVASLDWRKDATQFKNLTYITGIIWLILETFLFGLIGAQVTIESLRKDFATGLLILFLGIVVRFLLTVLSLFGSNLNLKEKIFISASWISKATVQAAVGSQALEYMKVKNKNQLYGEQVLSISVLSIILTAPLGAIFIHYLGPYLLADRNSLPKTADERSSLLHVTTDDETEVEPSAPEESTEYRRLM